MNWDNIIRTKSPHTTHNNEYCTYENANDWKLAVLGMLKLNHTCITSKWNKMKKSAPKQSSRVKTMQVHSCQFVKLFTPIQEIALLSKTEVKVCKPPKIMKEQQSKFSDFRQIQNPDNPFPANLQGRHRKLRGWRMEHRFPGHISFLSLRPSRSNGLGDRCNRWICPLGLVCQSLRYRCTQDHRAGSDLIDRKEQSRQHVWSLKIVFPCLHWKKLRFIQAEEMVTKMFWGDNWNQS